MSVNPIFEGQSPIVAQYRRHYRRRRLEGLAAALAGSALITISLAAHEAYPGSAALLAAAALFGIFALGGGVARVIRPEPTIEEEPIVFDRLRKRPGWRRALPSPDSDLWK